MFHGKVHKDFNVNILVFLFQIIVYSEFDMKREISSVNGGHRASIAGDIAQTDQRASSTKGNIKLGAIFNILSISNDHLFDYFKLKT